MSSLFTVLSTFYLRTVPEAKHRNQSRVSSSKKISGGSSLAQKGGELRPADPLKRDERDPIMFLKKVDPL